MAIKKIRSEVVPSARARILRVTADDASKLIQERIVKGRGNSTVGPWSGISATIRTYLA